MSLPKSALLSASALCIAALAPVTSVAQTFERVASFPVFLNTDEDAETVAEIITAAQGGRTLVYTDSEEEGLGFIDLRRPNRPQADGFLSLGGEPTSVAATGPFVLAAINTSEDFVNVSGQLVVVDLRTRDIVRTIELGGQPDAVAVSKDGRFAAIAIENERDEDLGDGGLPQLPAGELIVVNTLSRFVDDWTVHTVPLTGLADEAPEDPEPEFVTINENNIAAVSLQENNHIVLVNLETAIVDPAASIVGDFSAGTVDQVQIDTEENDLIELTSSLQGAAREPDALTWIGDGLIATANEGDIGDGGRGFTIFNTDGDIMFEAGNSFDHLTASIGHYPENRSENRGNEPESILFAEYGDDQLLFVGSERASVVGVYSVNEAANLVDGEGEGPQLLQTLPTGVGPEGLLAIPNRNLFIVANEVDDRGDKIRSTVGVYRRVTQRTETPTRVSRGAYPLIKSVDTEGGTPIPWGALSALALDGDGGLLSVHDSFYRNTRIFTIDPGQTPASLNGEIILSDTNGLLAEEDDNLVEASGRVNLDAEGLAISVNGGYWIASEGAGTFDDDDRPVEFNNLLVKADASGAIVGVVSLPDDVDAIQRRFGFEGVASVEENGNEVLYVAFQREWSGDPSGLVRIGRYEANAQEPWTFAYYPIEAPTSPNGGWVGLSEIVSLGDGRFAVLERDNQAGPDARIKLITEFSIDGVTFQSNSAAGAFDVVTKTVVRDMIFRGDLTLPGGLILEKVEGLAVTPSGDAWWVNDNDGVDDSNGETQLRKIDRLFR
ncbi:MAG: esterase-like activity of phytase family protein [Pseudomonadota bacterium]